MTERTDIYFVSDVHLGLPVFDPVEREERFLSFLRAIDRPETKALYMLGDIWDFWYEYRDVIPKVGIRVVAHLVMLMESGVEVWFCPGNHDIWTFSFFKSIGINYFVQPGYFNIGGKEFCIGHGDLLGDAGKGYSLMIRIFRNKFAQRLFSLLHPWIAYRIGLGWSNSSRRTHKPYHFKGESEPLYRFAAAEAGKRGLDYCVFGHFHDGVDMTLPCGARFIVLKDWMEGGWSYARFDGTTFSLHCSDVRSL